MKRWIAAFAVTTGVLIGACEQEPPFQDPFKRPQIDWRPALVFDTGKATRILGNPSRLEKTTAYSDAGTRVYQAAFRDDWLDPATGKTGIVYYMYEEYPDAGAARAFLDSTVLANHLDPADGIRTAGGAELHYLTGGTVVRMALVLKGNRLVRLKVNQLTSRYRLDEFKTIVTSLADQL